MVLLEACFTFNVRLNMVSWKEHNAFLKQISNRSVFWIILDISLSSETNTYQVIVLFISLFSFSRSSGIFAPLSKITKADSLPDSRSNSRPTSASRIAQAQVSQSSSRASSRSSSRPNSRPGSRSNSPAPSSRVNGTDESLGFRVSFHNSLGHFENSFTFFACYVSMRDGRDALEGGE